jgi:Tesmin/TSO1-like CXC domain, cysteine-rich domain
MSSKRKLVQKEAMSDTIDNHVPLVTGVFAPSIMKRYIDTGIPMSTTPLRSPGFYNAGYSKRGLVDIPYTERARCKCQKAKCLQLYCECFARCFQCGPNCKCERSCQNNDYSEENREKRNQTIMELIKKDPLTFRTGLKRKLQNHTSVS